MTAYSPKVSVMIITYNQENLIAETIQSVLDQDYPNLEIVVADDASTDGTAKVILEFQCKYPEIVKPVLNKKNLGITGNSNAAFFACTGELIALLGGDDLFLPGKLSSQVEVFNDPAVVLSYHPVEIFNHHTNETIFITNSTKKEEIKDVYELISKGGIPGASSVMVRKSNCPAHGFHPAFPVVSDWIFCIEVAATGQVRELAGVYGKYRKHGLGASDRTLELLDESLRTLEIISKQYPEDVRMQAACARGGQRYIAGELFRQVIKGDVANVARLENYMLTYTKSSRYLFVKLVFVFLKNKIFLTVASVPLAHFKNFIKKRA
ncbi:glycosyltransferase family 2 protein [Pseudomonas fluorescens]|uniref:glycosyltransferase family 2 protein n=1 Tax=Pseudomonas fluorescens TaxID=294 RepID=UPI001BEBC40B|nr:glycosyltransferase family 2 protein [Pseudomonas fluorescens]MBT2374818.1 glycosyltransferase family 2 protein [Pseudomonas fluorescens]